MSDAPTDAQHQWCQENLGVDPRQYPSAGTADAGQGPGIPNGQEQQGSSTDAAPPADTQTASPPPSDAQSPAASTGNGQSASSVSSSDPNIGQPNQSVDPNAGQPNQSVDPNAGQPNQSIDPNSGQPMLASMSSGSPIGPDPCDDLLQQIIAILDDLAQRLQDGENDPHNLFENFRKLKDAHPDWGSWDGHRQKFYEVRDDLRRKLSEWEADERCRGPRQNKQEEEDLNEAYEFKDKEFPDKPLKPMKREQQPTEQTGDGITIEKVLEVLAVLGLSLALAATIVAALADPEPVSKLGLAGLSAAEINELMVMLGLGAKLATSQ